LNCGCLLPREYHGKRDNLTLTDLQDAAAAGGTTIEAAAWNIPRTLQVATSPAWPPTLAAVAGRPTLVWDVDGILAFTAEAVCAGLNSRFGTAYDAVSQRFFPGMLVATALPADQAAWLTQELSGFSLLGTAAPDWHAIDTMTDAANAGFPSVIVTERHPALAQETQQWLQGWGVVWPPRVIAVGLGNKPAYLATRYGPGRPAILIDDNPVTRRTVARPGIDVWLPERPYVDDVARDHTRVYKSHDVLRYWLGLKPGP
jgi:hypothetical protein